MCAKPAKKLLAAFKHLFHLSSCCLRADCKHRKELCKEARAIGEEGKVAVRNIRRDIVDLIKKAEKVRPVVCP